MKFDLMVYCFLRHMTTPYYSLPDGYFYIRTTDLCNSGDFVSIFTLGCFELLSNHCFVLHVFEYYNLFCVAI